ncbi:MAG: TPM domain-containing protein [Bdellovibrio sp.]|nr:TPM domain-containing protein [Bdellovibrio sp.]
MLKLAAYSIVLFSLSFGVMAKAFDVPPLKGPVMDEVGLLSRSAQAQIADQLFQIRQNSGPQIQVFITSSLQGESTDQVAIQLFDQWKLGDAKKDNGLIFLIAPKEKKMRIEVGRGLEGDIPDVIAKRIIADVVSPFFKRGEFDMGVAQGVAAIGHYLNATPEQKAELQQNIAQSGGDTDSKGGFSGLLIFLIVLVVWVLLFIFNPTLAIYLLFSLFSGGGGRGGSGGNWSGGGGGSSGGGASGDW